MTRNVWKQLALCKTIAIQITCNKYKHLFNEASFPVTREVREAQIVPVSNIV